VGRALGLIVDGSDALGLIDGARVVSAAAVVGTVDGPALGEVEGFALG